MYLLRFMIRYSLMLVDRSVIVSLLEWIPGRRRCLYDFMTVCPLTQVGPIRVALG